MRSSLKFAKDAKRQLIHASQGGGGGGESWGKINVYIVLIETYYSEANNQSPHLPCH